MDLGRPGAILSGLVVGAVGAGVFWYGRRRGSLKCIAIGLGMTVYPCFVPSVLAVWVIAAACAAGLYLLPAQD